MLLDDQTGTSASSWLHPAASSISLGGLCPLCVFVVSTQ